MAKAVNLNLWSGLSLWVYSRNIRLLWAGLPALVFGVAGLVLFASAAGGSQQDLEARYLDQARGSLKAGDYPAAMTCFDRIAYRGKERPEILFGQAQAALAMGRLSQAMTILRQLAPLDKPGYPPAHITWARNLLTNPTPDALRQAEQHLDLALQGDLEDTNEVYGMLGFIYVRRAMVEKDEAQKRILLGKANKNLQNSRSMSSLLCAAQMHKIGGDVEQSRKEAGQVARYYEAKVAANAKDSEARGLWVSALMILDQFPKAVSVLEDGREQEKPQSPGQASYNEALATYHAEWLEFLERDEKVPFKDKMDKMEKGLHYSPTNRILLKKLTMWARNEDPKTAEAPAALLDMVSRPEVKSPMAVMALGLVKVKKGDIKAARVHFELARSMAPENPEILNNLAMTFLEEPGRDVPRAMELVEEALRTPGNPFYLGTRGHILCLQGKEDKWQHALSDLTVALVAEPRNIGHHQDLATCYARLGVPDLSARHKALGQYFLALRFLRLQD